MAEKKQAAKKPAPKKKVEEKSPAKKLPPVAAVTNALVLNFRKEPKPDAEIIGTLQQGTTVYVDPSFESDDFYAVKVGDVDGFCMKKFVDTIEKI